MTVTTTKTMVSQAVTTFENDSENTKPIRTAATDAICPSRTSFFCGRSLAK
jgi:hypothetical protein